ncbi:sulfatase [Psychromarinibacter halotolerans]|uniref:Sulfatase n=1 Tax=Psychromarinibacter halotolerans TaxID=1775175 RepID=A0ABV7GRP5_9RHOB|nr:sulfatase [Psychromarinibacter halotolerans]MDF0598480.1 sulfatase [Psychromarinibacter halotolerans]
MTLRLRRWLLLILSAAFLHLLLIMPNHPRAVTWQALQMVPLELPVLLLGMLALATRSRLAGWVCAGLLLAVTLLKLADLSVYTAYGRGFDPLADMHLLPAAGMLLTGSIGILGTVAVVAVVGLVLAGMLFLTCGALRLWGRAGQRLPRAVRIGAGTVAMVFAALCATEIRTALNGWKGWQPPGSAFTARLAAENIRDFERSRAAQAEFRRAAAEDPWRDRDGLFARLDGRSVVIVFVESYGRTAFVNPLYAERHERTLSAGQDALADAGLAARSGWLRSPVQGGQSWLAHATLASGVEVSDQRRYRALLASERQTLFMMAIRARYETATVAPAIVLDWPEGPAMGFQRIWAAADLGYAGLPFNWVTMPDQYTLAAYDREVTSDGPLLAEIALISSHAPWTPVPEMLPWDAVGDGSVFNDQASAGPTPREVWSNRDSIRDHFGRTIDYAMQAVLSWAALPRDEAPLIILLGDHQPVEFVAQGGGKDVPVHLIGPPDALRLFDDWDWTDGMIPDPDLPTWPMSAFRDRFLDATSATGDAATQADGS